MYLHTHTHICTLQALSLWERACSAIVEREKWLKDLETFERSASDPSRLFAKGTVCYVSEYKRFSNIITGPDGSSNLRLKEAKKRKQIQSVITIHTYNT